MDFGEDFGQKIDLTVRIREILRNYPEGSSILKELIQNADDAGASEINFCLDRRAHGCASLAFEKLAPFQGAALLAHNNAVFTETDLKSIQRIGDSLKKDKSKGTKTGRFGVGFNSVYHLTDLPSFISGSKVVFFDPHAAYLPNVNPSNPGKLIDFVANRERLVERYGDQFAPFRAFGCDVATPFAGTLFRLPLRTAAQAARSKLSTHATTADAVGTMLHDFESEAAEMLIFLKHVARIRVYEWHDGAAAPEEVAAASRRRSRWRRCGGRVRSSSVVTARRCVRTSGGARSKRRRTRSKRRYWRSGRRRSGSAWSRTSGRGRRR